MNKLSLKVLILLCIPYLAYASEAENHDAIAENTLKLFQAKKFRELSRLENSYLTSQSRTADGDWKLMSFYTGVGRFGEQNASEEKSWATAEETALTWAHKLPASPAGHIAYAMALIGHGRAIRGVGPADAMKPENLQNFAAQIEKAQAYLLKTKKIAGRDPRWYETLLSAAAAQDLDESKFEKLFHEARTRFPYYYPIYFAAIDYLGPKWQGDRKKIEQFALKAVSATKKHDKTGIYAKIYWHASQSIPGPDLFTDAPSVWRHMSKAMDDVLAKYPDQWNINHFAYFACLAHDKEKTKHLISKIKKEPIIEIWKDSSGNNIYETCEDWSEKSLKSIHFSEIN